MAYSKYTSNKLIYKIAILIVAFVVVLDLSLNLRYNQVTFEWRTPEHGASNYRLYLDGCYNTTVRNTSGVIRHTITGLRELTDYRVNLVAVGPTGIRSSDTILPFTTPAAPPQPPTGLSISNITHNAATLHWSRPSGQVTGYRVYRNPTNTLVGTTTGANNTSMRINNLTPGTDHVFRVVAVGPGGRSGHSQTHTVRTMGSGGGSWDAPPGSGGSGSMIGTPPIGGGPHQWFDPNVRVTGNASPPTNLRFAHVNNNLDNNVTLIWNASVGNVSGYRIYTEHGLFIGSTSARHLTSFRINHLHPSTNYRFFVAAVDNNRNRASRSNVVGVRTQDIRERERVNDVIMSNLSTNLMMDIVFDETNQIAWHNSNRRQRERILQDFFNRINNIAGVSPRRELSFRNLSNAYGLYNINTGQITINSRLLDNGTNGAEITNYITAMLTIIHEARHEFQHSAIRNSNRFLISSETRGYWRNNFNNYIHPSAGDLFYAQPIEWDAFNFSGEGNTARSRLRRSHLRPLYEGSWPW